MNFDNKQIEDFKKVIEDIVDAQIKKHRITTYVAAIVKDVHTIGQNTVDVVIPPDTTRIITGIQNKTGESLEIGDSVEICTKNGTLSNAWVSVKHGTSSSLGGGNYILDDLPIGAQFAYSSATNIPEGCLVCDGSAVSRTDYSELFAVIGTTYGEGDGSTTFNLPDKRGRVSVGLDTTQTEFNTLGKHIGEKTHILTIDEMPNHDHYITAADQAATGNQIGSPRPYSPSGANNRKTEPVGGNQPHNNIQPTEVDIWLIKAKQRATNILPDATIYNGLDSTSTTDALSANMGNVLNNKFKNNMGNIIVESISSKNLFNKNDVVLDYYLSYDNGQPVNDTNMCYTNYYIEVKSGDKYTMSNTSATIFTIHYYDVNKNWLGYNNQNNNLSSYTVTIINNAKYVRLACGKIAKDSIQFEKGDKATEYNNYKAFGIIESGSNSNGSWIKYSDGTMICHGYSQFSGVNINTSWGSLYETANSLSLGNLPQEFISRPNVFLFSWQPFFIERVYNANNATSWGSFYPVRPTIATNMEIGVSKLAIGKWK